MLGNSSEQERTFSETLITVTLGELDEKINTTLMPVQSIRRHSQHLKTAILPAHLKLTDYHVLSCILIVSCKHKPRDVFPGYNAMFCRELLGPKIHVYPNIQSVADEEQTAPCHTAKTAQACRTWHRASKIPRRQSVGLAWTSRKTNQDDLK